MYIKPRLWNVHILALFSYECIFLVCSFRSPVPGNSYACLTTPNNAPQGFLGDANTGIWAKSLPLCVGSKWTVTTCSVVFVVVSRYEQIRQCRHNVTLWHVRLMFVPPQLSKERDAILPEGCAVKAISRR